MSQSQHEAYLQDFRSVLTGRKPVVIVERRKSSKAWLKVNTAAIARKQPRANVLLADSSGKQDHAVIVGMTKKAVDHTRKLIADRDSYTREEFQRAMGRLLGYAEADIDSFTKSRLSLECGCQLCGGPTPESRLDDEARKRRE